MQPKPIARDLHVGDHPMFYLELTCRLQCATTWGLARNICRVNPTSYCDSKIGATSTPYTAELADVLIKLIKLVPKRNSFNVSTLAYEFEVNVGVARLGPIKDRYQQRHFQVSYSRPEYIQQVSGRS